MPGRWFLADCRPGSVCILCVPSEGAQGECVVQAAGWRCSLLSDAARRHCYRLPASDASEANPIVKCDGEHETEVGTHLECMDPPLDGGVPEDAWFCVECQQNSVYQVKAVVAKDPRMKRLVNGQRTGKACVNYRSRVGRSAMGRARHVGAFGELAGDPADTAYLSMNSSCLGFGIPASDPPRIT